MRHLHRGEDDIKVKLKDIRDEDIDWLRFLQNRDS
jgi:hypothetical protein